MDATILRLELGGGGGVSLAAAQRAVRAFLSDVHVAMDTNARQVIETLGLESAGEKAQFVRDQFEGSYQRCADSFDFLFATKDVTAAE